MDFLEAGRVQALVKLRHLKLGEEMQISGCNDEPLLWLGLGLLVGTGALYYKGDRHFSFSTRGKRWADQVTDAEVAEAERFV